MNRILGKLSKSKVLLCLIFIVILILFYLVCYKIEGFFSLNFNLDDKGKLVLDDRCKFSGHGFNDDFELGECSIAIQVIPLCKNVLEIGGGAGKVSHMINSLLNDKTQHIVIEPGSEGIGNHGDENIYKNKEKFNDEYTVVKKFAENLTKEDLNILNDPPDCLYVDCEGCLDKFHNTEIGDYVLNNVRFIVNEMDGFVIGANIDNKIREKWQEYGFKKVGTGYGCGISCETEIWSKL